MNIKLDGEQDQLSMMQPDMNRLEVASQANKNRLDQSHYSRMSGVSMACK